MAEFSYQDRRSSADQQQTATQRKGKGVLEDRRALQPAIQRKAPTANGLPEHIKSGVESLSGMSMDDVKVHYNSPKPAQLNALAYAQGNDIHMGPGQERHLAHEAWHVVQQAQGRVKPTAHIAGAHINDAPSLENEADRMGARAATVPVQRREIPAAPGTVAQLAGHRPDQGMTIVYQGNQWNVTVSARNNPSITIRRNNATQHINWATANFTIVRVNDQNDHDLRQGEAAYDAPGFMSGRERQILDRFAVARARALTMIKNIATPHVNQANTAALNAITLDSFSVTKHGVTLVGPSSTQPAEWELTWREGDRRTWKFVIDVDNPEADSHQEPHVGWEVSAEAGTQAAVARTLGHVWLDHVPTTRGALVA